MKCIEVMIELCDRNGLITETEANNFRQKLCAHLEDFKRFAASIRADDQRALETSFLTYSYGGNFTLIKSFTIKFSYLNSSQARRHSFFRM